MDDKVIPVKVAVRSRPLVDKEINEGCQTCVTFVPGEPQVIIGKDKAFTFDFVYSPAVCQEDVYLEAVLPLVQGLFKGYNATVLAYGQTGSGKTYTMGGAYGMNVSGIEEITGVIPRVIKDLFESIQDSNESSEFTVKISYFEIYKEDLLDLLVPLQKRDKDQISIREDVSGGIKLIGLNEVVVSSAEEIMRHLVDGSMGRTTGATAMNNQSSRSHAIFTIHLERKSHTDSHDYCKAKFHLVDLAGSERIKKTLAEGERLKEGININRGLLALGNVISALGDENAKRGHIPYRDSKLTRLLQDSLGGNSHTLMIACISPADSNLEETVSTLRYADRARKIKNKPIVNRDPQVAEILRLRQLVMDLQCGKMPVGVSGSNDMVGGDYKSLLDRNKKLEEDNRKLATELQSAVSQNTDVMEKFVRAELSREQLKSQLQELKQKTGLSISQLLNVTKPCVEEGETQTSYAAETLEQHLNIMKLVHDKIEEIEVTTNEPMETINEEAGDSAVSDASMMPGVIPEEMRNKHVLRQAQLSRELQELNVMLARKQELAGQMLLNDGQLQAMRTQYESQMKEMESEITALQKEKEELNNALQSVKASSNSSKLAEQRRKRLQELESQISELRRKMMDQQKMLKLKELTDKQVEKLNQEIMSMKQQRVKLMNQIKDDAEQFRRLKAEMSKEVMQLKSQDRKRQAEIARLERQHVNQQAVLRRKAEEAAAANNRLKEVLQRQKIVAGERQKKQDSADLSGIGARVRKILGEELDFLVSVEEAKMHLSSQITSRKEITEQLNEAKKKFETSTLADEDANAVRKQVIELDQQVELCNTQIAELQQKLIDADQDEKCKSRWNNIHTMVEAKCAMKWLLNVAVANKVEADKKDSDICDLKTACEEAINSLETAEEEQKTARKLFEQELHSLRQEYESKVLYLMTQLRDSSQGLIDASLDTVLKKRIHFQEVEIARLARLHEEFTNKVEECNSLRKELTKVQYNMTLGRAGSLMPNAIESIDDGDELAGAGFFKPHFYQKGGSKRRKTFGRSSEFTKPVKSTPCVETISDEGDSSDDDQENDPDWVSGLTPGFGKKNLSRINRIKSDSDAVVEPHSAPVLCKCKTDCTSKRCACCKEAQRCSDACGCIADRCCNRSQRTPESTTSTKYAVMKSSDETTLNHTFTVDSVVEGGNSAVATTTVQSRKRSSENKKSVIDKVLTCDASVAADDSSSDSVDPLSESGISALTKKRKLQPTQASYFGAV